MKEIRTILGAGLVSCALLTPIGLNAQTSTSIGDLLEHVRRAVSSVNNDERLTSLPPITRISLTLNTIREQQTEGQFRLLIFNISRNQSSEFVRTINVELTPPQRIVAPTDSLAANLGEELASAILDTALAVQAVPIENREGDLMGVSNLSVTVKFGVQSQTTMGVQVTVLQAGVQMEREAIQEITIEFGDAS